MWCSMEINGEMQTCCAAHHQSDHSKFSKVLKKRFKSGTHPSSITRSSSRGLISVPTAEAPDRLTPGQFYTWSHHMARIQAQPVRPDLVPPDLTVTPSTTSPDCSSSGMQRGCGVLRGNQPRRPDVWFNCCSEEIIWLLRFDVGPVGSVFLLQS